MKNIYSILLVAVCTIFSCKKKDLLVLPSVTTTAVSNITDSTATGGGTITADGTTNITIRGVEWGTSAGFISAILGAITDGNGTGTYSCHLTGLFPATTYYVRAYAISGISDTTYGNIVQFTTPYIPGKYTVTTLAGTGVQGSMDGDAAGATFTNPEGVTVDAVGNVYVADGSNKIRKVTPGGVVTTLAPVSTTPSDVAVDSLGNIYLAMPVASAILKFNPVGTLIPFGGSGFIGFTNSMGVSVAIVTPSTLDIDRAANLYVGGSSPFLKISPAGVITTLPSNFAEDFAIAVDSIGDVYESNRLAICKVTPAGTITAIAGGTSPGSQDGTGSAAGFGEIDEIKVGPDGNIYVADATNGKIRMVTPSGVVTTIAGTGATGATDGNSGAATFNGPTGLAIDKAGNIYVADIGNNKIRKISPL